MAFDMGRRRFGGDPFGDMVPLRAAMDRLLENALSPGTAGDAGRAGGGFGLDVDEDDDAFYVACHLPGLDPNDVQIQLHDNVLTIAGETRRRTPEGRRPLVQGATYGRFERQLALGTAVDAAQTEADYRDGILEIRIPKAESSRPRTIPVRGAAPRQGEQKSRPEGEAPRHIDMRGAGAGERAGGGQGSAAGSPSEGARQT